MADLHNWYVNLCNSNGIRNQENIKTRRELKTFIQHKLPGLEFSDPKRRNESERVYFRKTKNAAIEQIEQETTGKQLQNLLDCAKFLRKTILNAKRWTFEGSMGTNSEQVPESVSLFFKWCLVGESSITSEERGVNDIDVKANRLAETLMFECLSQSQISRISQTNNWRHVGEFPFQTSIGLSIYQLTRSARIVNFLYEQGLSIHYSRIRDIVNNIAKSVIVKMNEDGGIYLPPDVVHGKFIHFALDNIDFQEDTPDGRNNLHGTIMVAYQTLEDEDETENIRYRISKDEDVSIPDNVYPMFDCYIPKTTKPNCNMKKVDLPLSKPQDILVKSRIHDLTWMLGMKKYIDSLSKAENLNIFTWSAYNSLINETRKKTRISVMPLISSSPTETSVQYTALNHLENVTRNVWGSERKTVITVDLGLYRPLKHLQMYLNKDNIVLIPGDLHIIMAALRAIGKYIDGTGIPEIWIEAGLFGDTTVRHLLEGKPVRRSIRAHITTLNALYIMLFKEFFKTHSDLRESFESIQNKLSEDSNKTDLKLISLAFTNAIEAVESLQLYSKLDIFCVERSKNSPTFKMVYNYMIMVFDLLSLLRAVRSAQWELRLAAIDEFTKYFFALDLRNYSALCALHIVEMNVLKNDDVETWNELSSGKLFPNKTNNAFCSLGADEALEQENRRMKVSGGIVGITQDISTLNKFFLTSPELAKLCTNCDSVSNITRKFTVHHEVSRAASNRYTKNVNSVVECFSDFVNPFLFDECEMVNLVNRTIAPENVKNDVASMPSIGLVKYQKFTQERFIEQSVNFWDTIHQCKLKLFSTVAKKVKVKTKCGEIILKEDRKLFNRLIILCRSRPEIDLKQCIGKYELAAVPRSMFGIDGKMNSIQQKSKLMHHLEDVISKNVDSEKLVTNEYLSLNHRAIAVVDGMTEIHKLKVNDHTKTMSDLADQFCINIFNKYSTFSEIHIVFDTYVENSVKMAAREKRLCGKAPIMYKIEKNMGLKSITLSKLLSHDKNKATLSELFSLALIEQAIMLKKDVVVSYCNKIKATIDVRNLISSQEEADTKIILHAIHARRRNFHSLKIFSPDTDVLILAIYYYTQLPEETSFVFTGQKRREISVKMIYQTLGEKKASALLGLHAISGSDTTGSFSGKSKTSFWKRFMDCEDTTLESLSSLGQSLCIKNSTFKSLEEFICSVYMQAPKITTLSDLRWFFFSKRQTESICMPPTQGALLPAIRRAHYQSMIWKTAHIPKPDLPPVTDWGWTVSDTGVYEPVMCDISCAPEELLSIVRCCCTSSKCVSNCKCVQNGLSCTEMCLCSGDIEKCLNNKDADDDSIQDSSPDESDDDF